MKRLYSLLIELAAFGIPVALCVGIMIGTERGLGWPQPWPMVSVISFLVVVIGCAVWWLKVAQKRENRTTGRITDACFGEVQQKPFCWEAEVVFTPTGERITISSFEGTIPTERQRTTFREITGRWDQMVRQIDDALDAYGKDIVPARPRHLKYSSIGLDSKVNEWSVDFDVGGSKAQWGFSAEFRGDTLDTLEDIH